MSPCARLRLETKCGPLGVRAFSLVLWHQCRVQLFTLKSALFVPLSYSIIGAGLTRVLAAIRVRAGPTVSLVFESPQQRKLKGAEVAKQAAAAREARERAQAKRDELLKELEADEKKLKKGKFLGLF